MPCCVHVCQYFGFRTARSTLTERGKVGISSLYEICNTIITITTTIIIIIIIIIKREISSLYEICNTIIIIIIKREILRWVRY